MKRFISYPLILSLFLTITTSYGQDFLDDLYISNNNENSSYVVNNTDILTDTISNYDDYDYDYDYEDRIHKFHNPNYRFRYGWDYGWNDPYWSNWYSPSWSLSYHNYGYHSGWGMSYNNYWGWGHNWYNPYWGYGWNDPYAYHYPSHHNHYGINSWSNNLFFVYNTNNHIGHLYSHDTNIRPKPNTSSRLSEGKGNVGKEQNLTSNRVIQKIDAKQDVNNNRINLNTINNIRPINNQKTNISNGQKVRSKNTKNNIINQIADEVINYNRKNKSNSNNNTKPNRNSNFNSNKNNRSSTPNRSSRSSNNTSRRN